jgi:hypothetical protein
MRSELQLPPTSMDSELFGFRDCLDSMFLNHLNQPTAFVGRLIN